MKKANNIIFVCIIVGVLLAGFVKTVFFPEDINELENRYANKISKFTIEAFLKGSFQEDLADALSDQVLLSTTMKKNYNYANASFEKFFLTALMKDNTNRYVSYKGGLLFGDYIVYKPRDYSELKEKHEAKIQNILGQVKNHPEINFFVYYIEKDTDIHFDTNEKIGASEYLEKKFDSKGIPFTAFKINNYKEFTSYFYRTDHHWNSIGSYKAYGEVLDLLKVDENLVPIKEEHLLDYNFSGSKSIAIGATEIFMESFPAYRYDYPEMDIAINDKEVDDYGNQDKFIDGELTKITYGAFYGGDNGKIVFDTGRTDKENILIIGESYDNAILKLLAGHFNQTHSIDLRNYESTYGEKFSFSTYVQENNIDKVLLIGNIDYFTMEEFMLED